MIQKTWMAGQRNLGFEAPIMNKRLETKRCDHKFNGLSGLFDTFVPCFHRWTCSEGATQRNWGRIKGVSTGDAISTQWLAFNQPKIWIKKKLCNLDDKNQILQNTKWRRNPLKPNFTFEIPFSIWTFIQTCQTCHLIQNKEITNRRSKIYTMM